MNPVDRPNDEFFARYKEHYEAFCAHLLDSETRQEVFRLDIAGKTGKELDHARKPVRDFVKRLLSRLIFLQFLQQKGWLGCPALPSAQAALSQEAVSWEGGQKNFVRRLFDDAGPSEQERFYSARLAPLFFDTLNNANRPGHLFVVTRTRVPFLNGGLFARDFEGVDGVDFPAVLFRDLFDFFGQYRFTIDEINPEEGEISIDPGMLGHIFEKLLEDHKDKGAYYTPRGVVRFMAQRSLVHALAGRFPDDPAARDEIEKLIREKGPMDSRGVGSWLVRHAAQVAAHLDDLKICDPAVGCGAFVIGLLEEICQTRLTLDPTLDRAAVKRRIIQQSIHGVDLDAGAVEVARLRCWLALIVDEHAPRPLPDLDRQIRQGNSLLESFEEMVKTEGKGGFDVVIANPPYISAIDYRHAFGEAARDELKRAYTTATGAWDIYVLFFEVALRLLHEGGVACFITPNKYLAAPYAKGLRRYLLAHGAIRELVDVSGIRAFRRAEVYPVITVFGRNAIPQGVIRVFSPWQQGEQEFDVGRLRERHVEGRYLTLLPENLWGFLLSEHYALLDRVIPRTRPLGECGQVNASSTAAEADSYGRCFVDDPAARWRLVNTGIIERYESLWGREKLVHQGRQFLHPALPEAIALSDARRRLYDSPKIIFAKMALVCEAFPDLEGGYASVNTNCFYAPNDGGPLGFYAAVFNSRMFTFLYELYFGALRMAGGYFQWGSPQLRLTAIPQASPAEQATLSALVDRMLSAKRTGDGAVAMALEAEIDARVCLLYGVAPEEIALTHKGTS